MSHILLVEILSFRLDLSHHLLMSDILLVEILSFRLDQFLATAVVRAQIKLFSAFDTRPGGPAVEAVVAARSQSTCNSTTSVFNTAVTH